ncbi:hypothetical protein [Acidithiobacillus sp.]|jgi:hypothetical protein|uniref:hypothetical protein n=1 Tax=Acidithiobacillus sp. TaxID=1872118 RepID=UPI003564DE04
MSATLKPFITDTSDLEPLTPPGTDLRHGAAFEVDIVNLLHSEFIHLATNEELGAAARLCLRSLFQVPAGSLPNDEIILAKLAGCDHRAKAWQRVRAMALYGWALCSDGRLYHQETARMVFAFLVGEDTRKWADEERNAARARRARKKPRDGRTGKASTQSGGRRHAVH